MSEKDFKEMTKAELLEYLEGEPKDVYQALNAVMGRVGYVQKQETKDLPYSFASEVAFIKAVRPHMVDVGLILFQSGVELLDRTEFISKRGTAGISVLFAFWWTWVHAPSGTSFVCTSVGESMDYGDKAANKAMTVGMKYALRQTLVIETGDDPDYTGSDQFERELKQAQERKADETGLPVPGKNDRAENQWEKKAVDAIMDLQLVEAKPHAVNILNNSVFFSTVAYGDLETVDAVAYLMAWEYSKEKYPDDDTPARAKRVDEGYGKFLEKAAEALGG